MNGNIQDDILVEIPNSELPKLLKLYEEKASWAPYLQIFVKSGIKWKQIPQYNESITFYSPNGCWEQDGTIIVTLQFYAQEIHVFTLDEECKNLYKGLSETKKIDYERAHNVFYAIHENFVPTLSKIVQEKKFEMDHIVPCTFYSISPNEASKFSIECPDDVLIKKLDSSAATGINKVWPHRYRDSDKFIATLLDLNGGYGIFLKSTNEMVGWIVKHIFGYMTMLQVKEEHGGRGFGTLLIKVLSKEIAEEGHYPCATVVKGNKMSEKIFEKLRFQLSWSCTYFVPKDLKN